jgi:hypothetical protein
MTVVAIALSIVVAVLVALLMKKGNNTSNVLDNLEPEAVSMEEKAKEEAENMSDKEKNRLLKQWEGKSRDIFFGSTISGKVTNLQVDYIKVHGNKYDSIQDALDKNKSIPENYRYKMALVDAELAVLRNENMSLSRHYHTETSVFCGTVHIYKPCIIGVETIAGPNANKAARMAVKIEKDEHGYMGITEIFVATSDIANASNFTTFVMVNDEDKFDKLIRADKKYMQEVAEIDAINERLEKYNYLIEEDLLTKEGNKFLFKAPTEKQIKEIKALENSAKVNPTTSTDTDTTTPINSSNPFADMVSSKE